VDARNKIVGTVRLREARNERLAAALGRTVNEIQLALAGLRGELLHVATSYGLMRAAANGDIERLDDWREWLIYTQRVEAWLTRIVHEAAAAPMVGAADLSA